jgi:predicted transcriptional regulator
MTEGNVDIIFILVQQEIKKENKMNIKAEKLKLIEWLVQVEDEAIIERVKLLKEGSTEKIDWLDTISATERMAIDEGLQDLEKGDTVPHEEVRKNYEKWL